MTDPIIRKYTDGSYSVDGTVYNDYTKQPSRMLTLTEAAERVGVSVRTMRKKLKNNPHLRTIDLTSGPNLLDYEVDHWLATVVNRSYPKRTWVKALGLLRSLRLINRDTLLEKLQARHDQEWTDIQRKVNDFTDSHVEAYQRGVKDAMYIVQQHAIEAWDYVPKIGQRISVGGCGGDITKITDTHVYVSGTYTYYMGEDRPGLREDWCFSYEIKDLVNGAVRPYWPLMGKEDRAESKIVWDYEGIPHNSYTH